MTDEKVTADEIIAAMREADTKKKSGKGGSALLPTPDVDSPLPVTDVPGETGGPVSRSCEAPRSLRHMPHRWGPGVGLYPPLYSCPGWPGPSAAQDDDFDWRAVNRDQAENPPAVMLDENGVPFPSSDTHSVDASWAWLRELVASEIQIDQTLNVDEKGTRLRSPHPMSVNPYVLAELLGVPAGSAPSGQEDPDGHA